MSAIARYFMEKDLGNKYMPKSAVQAWNKAHGKDSVTQSVVKALQEVKIETTAEQNDDIGKALADEVGKQLQKDMQDFINRIQKQ